jgi:hypothetical protein
MRVSRFVRGDLHIGGADVPALVLDGGHSAIDAAFDCRDKKAQREDASKTHAAMSCVAEMHFADGH